MNVASSSTQRHRHTDLQPLNTLVGSTRTRSLPSSNTASVVLPSPSILAARAYFLKLALPTAIEQNVQLHPRGNSTLNDQHPRRHSVQPSLSTQLNNFAFTPHPLLSAFSEEEETISPTVVKLGPPTETETKPANEPPKPSTTHNKKSAKRVCATPQEVFKQVPFEYTHQHLRDWGSTYLGNSATADAFVNAVSLRRPSLPQIPDDENGNWTKGGGKEMVTIRARIIPRQKERKPFLIQRKFDVEGLREGIPVSSLDGVGDGDEGEGEGGDEKAVGKLRRSSRIRKGRANSFHLGEVGLDSKTEIKPKHRNPNGLGSSSQSGLVPIHIEYALHFLPVLAALMLSGHVRKGDGIDLPLPFPECWEEVVGFVYTGVGSLSRGGREDLLFLGGRV